MSALNGWLEQATRHLSRDSAARVRSEIQDHYEAARESARFRGATDEDADRLAVADLGDAQSANRQYRKVLLTSSEARMLRQANWEAHAVCSRTWVKGLMFAIPVTAIVASAITREWTMFACGVAMALLLAAPWMPVYTPARSRIFRAAKWLVLAATLVLGFKWSWLMFACLWPIMWMEWTRISARRKLPVAQWPTQLYL